MQEHKNTIGIFFLEFQLFWFKTVWYFGKISILFICDKPNYTLGLYF
jgi:hypothetical protein